MSWSAVLRGRDWSLELGALAAAVVVVGVYLHGRSANAGIARAVGSRLAPVLRAQFAAVGAVGPDGAPRSAGGEDAGPLEWAQLSDASFSTWATGRRGVYGACAELHLLPRQDALGALLGVASPQLASALGGGGGAVGAACDRSDTLVLELPLRPGGDGFVLAVVRARERRGAMEAHGDLRRVAPKVATGASFGLGGALGLEVLCEHRDIGEELARLPLPSVPAAAFGGAGVPRTLAGLLSDASGPVGGALRVLHVTDLAGMAGVPTAAMSPRVLRLVLDVPRADREGERAGGTAGAPSAVGAWAAAACDLADGLAGMRLGKAAAGKVAEGRGAMAKEREREAAAEGEAKRRAAKEEAERAAAKARAAAVAGMDRESRRKLEVEERRKQLEASMPKARMKRM